MEQRYQAVLEVVVQGATVTEVAGRYGVSRASVHTWIRRYEAGGVAALADRSHRPDRHPRQLEASIEALVCELRRAHPRWGPQRLVHELKRREGKAVSRSTVYRVLVRHHLVDAKARKRRREDYRRWEREGPMELWQMDVMGSVMLVDGTELKLISGIDDHSRFCVIAKVVRRPTSRAVCTAFVEAMGEYGIPDEMLSDNGKVFTGRFTRPRPGEVLFERICRENGIRQRLTPPWTPTTTGKVERFHQTIRRELLNDAGPFADLAAAQAAVDRWRHAYNNERPHQSLGMATPASRFRPVPSKERQALPLVLPPQLKAASVVADGVARDASPHPIPATGRRSVASTATNPAPDPVGPDVAVTTSTDERGDFGAVEIERVVPSSGNLKVRPQQFWIGTALAGTVVGFWIDTTTVHLSIAGRRIKTLPSRFTTTDLARLRAHGARRAGPPPAASSARGVGRDVAVEVDRTVNASGTVGLGKTTLGVGAVWAGRRVTLRLEADVIHVVVDGVLARTLPSPFRPEQRSRLAGARLAGPPPELPPSTVRVQRRVSVRGNMQVVDQRVQVGIRHAHTIVDVEVQDRSIRVLSEAGEVLKTVARTTAEEVKRFKAYGSTKVRSG